jgi:hypothetical protein
MTTPFWLDQANGSQRASARGPVASTPTSVLVVVGHLEEALVEAVIFEDLSIAASLSSDFGFLRHSWAPFRDWLIHPRSPHFSL